MVWPLPSKLRFASQASALGTLEVEVLLLDGKLIHGVMRADENLPQISELKLMNQGQDMVIKQSDIRSLACIDELVPVTDSTALDLNKLHLEHEELLAFHALFIDGKTLDGQTCGYVNMRAGGVFLYDKQDDFRYRALWIPRNSLQGIRVDTPDNLDLPADSIESRPSAQVNLSPEESRPAELVARKFELATNMDELSIMLEESRGKPMISAAQALHELKLMDEETFHEMQADKSGKLRAYIDDRLAKSEVFKLQLEHARAHMVNTPEVNADIFQIERQALAKLPWKVATKQAIVPLGIFSGTLYVASCVPMSRELEDRLSMIAGCRLALVWASKNHIDSRITRENQTHLPLDESPVNVQEMKTRAPEGNAQDLQSLLASAQNEIKVEGSEIISNLVDERSSVVLLVKRMITDAHKQKASDIHIETNPGEEPSRIRFRIDGDLEEYLTLPADLRAALVSRVKVMSKLDISERRRPQDGKINFADFSDIKLELRVAILPTHDNLEDVVMRLLASSTPIPLAQLGFSNRDADIVKRMSLHPYGLLLACGPTGSGKTTTLHSLLSEINTDNRKIWTAEDPIEITQSGLRQLQVNPKIGLTFAAAMRAFLRADPDVVMIGEVRDEETARVCIEASLTGHLVFSTLHTNGAAESVVRLLDLGMDPLNFGDSLIGIVAQRLVRGLCKHCAAPKVLSEAEFEALVQEYVEGTAITAEEGRKRLLTAASGDQAAATVSVCQAVGCDLCGGRGYKGRMGIYEVLENVGDMKHKIQKRAPTSEIFAEASKAGMRTLRQDALEKVVSGLIDLTQARTVYA